jgi:hypothetical protein
MTRAEYQEMLTTQRVLGKAYAHSFYIKSATRACRALKGISRLTYSRLTEHFYTATESYLRADSAAHRAASARGMTGKCLDFLVFTPRQATAMRRIGRALDGFEHALTALNLKQLETDGKRADNAIESGSKVLLVAATVTVCRHE